MLRITFNQLPALQSLPSTRQFPSKYDIFFFNIYLHSFISASSYRNYFVSTPIFTILNVHITLLNMSKSGEYYNEEYAPIHDDYLAAQARLDLQQEAGSLAESTAEDVEMEQTTSSEKRRSRYDEDNYALPDLDEDSSPPTSSANTSPNVVISTQDKVVGCNKILNWKQA